VCPAGRGEDRDRLFSGDTVGVGVPGTALIAGVGPTIGEAVARELHAAGYPVGLFARSGDVIDALAADLGADACAVQTDITDAAAVERATDRVREALGPIEVLVLNASGGGGNPVEEASVQRLRELFDVRVAGGLACVTAARGDLQQTNGTIIVSGTTYADGHAAEQLEWGAVAPATRGLARSLDDGLTGVQVSYVELGTAVAPDGAARQFAVPASAIAEKYRQLTAEDTAYTREVTLDQRD
jgi:NADP-dependent 3-hydroxy acid dehydrogenase YdfG